MRDRQYALANRQLAVSFFLRGPDGRRPVYGGQRKLQEDRHWREHILFHEYFHGDNGAGIGASHQTGWTGTVALLFLLEGALDGRPGAIASIAE